MKIPDFVLRFIGREIAQKANLQEGNMDGTKKWYQSKNIWTSIVTGLVATYIGLSGQVGWPAIPEWVITILAAVGVYTRVNATDKIG
jgi:hypothetical protein